MTYQHLCYLTVTTMVLLGYLAAVILVQWLIGQLIGLQSELAIISSALVAAVVLHAPRARIQATGERRRQRLAFARAVQRR